MDKAMELLEQLAIKLGVAVEYLWTTLVKQQYVEGITCIAMIIIDIIIIIVLLCCIPRATKSLTNKYKELAEDRRKNGTGYNGSYVTSSEAEDYYNIFSKVIPIVGYLLIFALILFIISNVKFGIQQLLNPDYFALKEILDAISGSAQ